MKRDIVYYGNSALRKKAELIEVFDDELKKLAEDMIETVRAYDGVGLAGNQIAVLKRIFLICPYYMGDDNEWKVGPPKIFVNPTLSEPSEETEVYSEGCLSIPKLYEDIERPHSITVTYQDIEGNEKTERFEGHEARQIMHENDHLNGVLHIDRLPAKRRRAIEPLLRRIKKKYK